MSTSPHDPPQPQPEAADATPEPLPRALSPRASLIFLVLASLILIAGIVLAVMANSGEPDGQKGALGLLLIGVGGIGFAAWVVIQVLGRMVMRIMLRDVRR